jgi:hypothetical protein
MRKQTFNKAVLYCSLMIVVVLSAQVIAQPSSSRGFRGRGIYGDWQVKVQFGERQMESILSFSRNQEGQYTGQWISFWGVNDLKDVKFEDNKLSFVQVIRFGDNEFTQNFTGTVEDGKLTGVLSSDRGESKLEGQRSPRMPRGVGNWELKYKFGDREITSTLAIKANKEGELTGEWQSRRGESKISDLQFDRRERKLTFKRVSKFQDRQFESTFEGTIGRDNTLTGVIKSDRGEVQVEGKLIGAPLIGTWNLDIESERGPRKQRLRVNPDMSALYGSTLIKKINFDGDKVSFKYTLTFGDQEFETSFAGKLAESKLTGEFTNPRGTQKVTGTKVVRTFRRRNTQ